MITVYSKAHIIFLFLRNALPGSKSWDASQWLDESKVLAAFDSEYGTNFTRYPRDFDTLIEFIVRFRTEKNLKLNIAISKIAQMTPKLAEKIWPGKSKKVLIKSYINMHESSTIIIPDWLEEMATIWSDDEEFLAKNPSYESKIFAAKLHTLNSTSVYEYKEREARWRQRHR